MIKIKYDTETDILTIILKDDAPVDAIEEPGGIIVSYNEKEEPVSIEFLNVSAKRIIQEGEVNVIFQTKSVL
ncbi:MAG: DUF2283 domain-containing protein [bacterium]